MSTYSIGFYEDFTKLSLNYHHISSNTHLISSAVLCVTCIYTTDRCCNPSRNSLNIKPYVPGGGDIEW